MNQHSSAPLTITADVVVAGGAVHRPGWITVDGGVVTGVGSSNPGGERVDLGDAVVVPGFVDMHVHGGGGGSFTSDSPADIRRAIATHRAHGTTMMVASLVSAHPAPLAQQVARLAPFVERGELAGIHLEGPWLAPARCGAHDPASLRVPTLDEVQRLLDAGRGTIRMVTPAPELPGALEAVELLREHGVVVAVGHTNATYDQTREAIGAGATVGTHLFNAMRPIDHREPGPIIALTEEPGVVLEVIADGVHLHPVMLDSVRRLAGPGRIALVTDSMAAAGMPDGVYELGGLDVDVTDRVARLTEAKAIAGSTATTDVLFRAAAGDLRLADDDRLLDAVRMTAATPLHALGLAPRDLSVGSPADLVVLTPDTDIAEVMCRGAWVDGVLTQEADS